MKSFCLLCCLCILFACKKGDDLSNKPAVIINKNQFSNADSDPFTWKEVSIKEDCLSNTIGTNLDVR